ncbi:hypothetical protein [Nocardia beijingensis]|uniref:PH domain-containing protein n=1 Tax=Nocardia beijingensis TaxID=95162 RepID=A0ABW7WKE4_9NOCA
MSTDRDAESNSTASPPPGPAAKWPPTRAALRHNWLLRWPLLLSALACGPLAVVMFNEFDHPGVHGWAKLGRAAIQPVALFFVFGTMFGGVFVWINRRRRKALFRHPWTVWPIRYISAGKYEWIDLLGPSGEIVATLILSTWAWDRGKLVDHKTQEVWFAGDPSKYGVVSRPGGGDMRYAYVSRVHKAPRFTFQRQQKDPAGGRHAAD